MQLFFLIPNVKGKNVNSKKGLKNLVYGILSQIITVTLGIIIPRLVLVNLGSEANGLLNSTTSILSYMSLLEAGVGTATLQALYKPIAKNAYNSVNRIMAATDYFYRRTGYIYLVLVIILASTYSLFVKSELTRLDIFLVVFLTGLSGVISYFFQGKYSILLQAEGKNYIATNAGTIRTIGTSLLKVVLLVAGFQVVAVQTSYFIFNLIQMLIIVAYIRKHYKWLDLGVEPDFQAISQKNAVLIHQISGLIFGNTDVLVLTIFTSLKEVSLYSMYALIFGLVKTLTVVLSGSFTYALGQSYSDKERFLRIFNAYEIYTLAITFSLFCITKILILPFLTLYTAGVIDMIYIDHYLPWLFIVFYLLHNGRVSSSNVISVAQRFEDTKWRSILESAINVTVSVVMVLKFGVYGVLIGTIAALLYRTNDMIIYAAGILKRSPLITYKRWGRNILIFAGITAVTSQINIPADNYKELFISSILLCITVIPAFILINSLAERESAKYAWLILKNTLRRTS